MDGLHLGKVNRLKRNTNSDKQIGKCCKRNPHSYTKYSKDSEKMCHHDSLQSSGFQKDHNLNGSFIMPILSIPDIKEYCSKSLICLTGTALEGRSGPPVGAVDIGVSKSAYYFRIALPGVKKDPGDFSCEIECDGRVLVRGVTSTGEKTVSRYSRVFDMKFQKQCPPGPFSLLFHLPGAVDPRLFVPNFRPDGVFEGVVIRNLQ